MVPILCVYILCMLGCVPAQDELVFKKAHLQFVPHGCMDVQVCTVSKCHNNFNLLMCINVL